MNIGERRKRRIGIVGFGHIGEMLTRTVIASLNQLYSSTERKPL